MSILELSCIGMAMQVQGTFTHDAGSLYHNFTSPGKLCSAIVAMERFESLKCWSIYGSALRKEALFDLLAVQRVGDRPLRFSGASVE